MLYPCNTATQANVGNPMGVVRTTFLIDEQGTVQAVMPKVKPDTNADEILALL